MDKLQSHFGYFRFSFRNLNNLDLPMTIKKPPYDIPVHKDLNNNSWSFRQSNDPLSTPSDLVSLAWLQKGDILQIAPLDGEEESNDLGSSSSSFNSVKMETSSNNCLVDSQMELLKPSISSISPTPEPNFLFSSVTNSQKSSSINSDQMSYDLDPPRFASMNSQGLAKPNYSYTHLIFMAIESTPQKCMTVNQIYNWCESNFPFYKYAGAGWKNSLRHNLSINKSFKRLPRDSRVSIC